MENLISGLLNTALDAASSLVHQPTTSSPTSSPPHTSNSAESSVDRSTWAEVVGGQEKPFHNSEENKHSRKSSHHQHQQSSSPEGRYEHQSIQCNDGDDMTWKKVDGWHPIRKHNQHGPSQEHYHKAAESDYGDGFNRPKVEDDGVHFDKGNNQHRPPPDHYHKVPDGQWHTYKKHPNRQQYAEPVDSSIDTAPTREELQNISTACNRLWELDLNRLTPGQDYEINCGEGKKVYEKEDIAFNSLFRFVKRDVFERPTYARFYALLDNYTAIEGMRERLTDEDRQEQLAFIEEISRTAPIQYLFKYLVSREIMTHSIAEFKQHLHSLWFDFYGRGGSQESSSAFEHVFIGEVKNGYEKEVSGFHNWIKFYVEEAAGRVDYQGYILPRRRSSEQPDAHSQLLSVQFVWNGVLKPISSIFVGVSPEFEVALYTLCFFAGHENNFVDVGPYRVNIKCYHLGKNKMGSSFPIVED